MTWSYDDTYQLTSERRSGANAYANTFTYDAAGNRTVKNEDTVRTTSVYDVANQLATSVDAAGTTTFTFDADGNQQVQLEPTGDRTTNTWDYENKTTKVDLPASLVNTFTYNPDGLRVQIENSEGTSKTIWDGQQYLAETDNADTTTVVYTNEPDQYTNLISQKTTTATSWFHFDALGSTREATNSSETVTDTFLYDAWGNVLSRSGTTRIPFQYVGRHGYYYDPDTGNSYVIMRIYDPVTARWQSVDPILADGLDWYLYALNNPVNLFDLSGLCVVCGYDLFDSGQVIYPKLDSPYGGQWPHVSARAAWQEQFNDIRYDIFPDFKLDATTLYQRKNIFSPISSNRLKIPVGSLSQITHPFYVDFYICDSPTDPCSIKLFETRNQEKWDAKLKIWKHVPMTQHLKIFDIESPQNNKSANLTYASIIDGSTNKPGKIKGCEHALIFGDSPLTNAFLGASIGGRTFPAEVTRIKSFQFFYHNCPVRSRIVSTG